MALDGDVGKLNAEQFELLDKAYKSNERIGSDVFKIKE
jgi:hypothetical protein